MADHDVIVTGSGLPRQSIRKFECVNIVLGHLKSAITGTYRAFNFARYAARYPVPIQSPVRLACHPRRTHRRRSHSQGLARSQAQRG
ncbi:hypothetical protein [Salinisphaera sp. Q1T1-3]|uniref:hypothetical protein n=1 Tax=Salinisphaera sp. Q1T1-3 TaxID=2321229 RepID=UPI00351A6942